MWTWSEKSEKFDVAQCHLNRCEGGDARQPPANWYRNYYRDIHTSLKNCIIRRTWQTSTYAALIASPGKQSFATASQNNSNLELGNSKLIIWYDYGFTRNISTNSSNYSNSEYKIIWVKINEYSPIVFIFRRSNHIWKFITNRVLI
jgi:hypothetical protein